MKDYPEKLIGAFLENYRVKDIAKAAGLAVSTINRYKRDPAFMAALNERRSAIVSAAVDRMRESILKDADVLQGIIEDPEVNPAVRANAINTKWTHLRAWKSLTDFESRLIAVEGASFGVYERFEPGAIQSVVRSRAASEGIRKQNRTVEKSPTRS